MPLCKNIPEGEKACYYTGKENTPRGRGYAARHCEGKSKKGNDGQMYVAKNGRWVKKTSTRRVRKTSPRMMYNSGMLSMYRPGKVFIITSQIQNFGDDDEDEIVNQIYKFLPPAMKEWNELVDYQCKAYDDWDGECDDIQYNLWMADEGRYEVGDKFQGDHMDGSVQIR